MKRIIVRSVIFACGIVASGLPVFAQPAAPAAPADWFVGTATLQTLGRDNVVSSKYEEYRVVPKGVSMPVFTLQGSQHGKDFALFGQNISQADQRYTGYAKSSWMSVAFDYNQIPHNMGNNGHSLWSETSPGVWAMNSTLRGYLGNAVDTQLPTATRTYPFYAELFAPTIAAAIPINISALRQRGSFDVALGNDLPFDLTMSYMREVKTGRRGNGGGIIYSAVNSIVEVPEPLNEVIQDIGFQAAVNRPWGNAHAAFAHNWYNDRQETLIVDNPLRATDLAWTAAAGAVPALGGPAQGRFINPADNEANTGSFGTLLKFAKQTRLTADVALGRWTQNAQLYPYTINSTVFTPSGVRADSLAALDRQSANGKMDTTSLNFAFSSRPAPGLGLRARFRSYDMANKTPTWIRTGSVGNTPDRSWTALTAADYASNPLGWATAQPYSTKNARFDAQASYDVNMLTIEGAYRHTQSDRTYREATKGAENGGSVSAILRSGDMLLFRGTFDKAKRTASGFDSATSIGLQADESERDSTRVGADLELNPSDKMGFVFGYIRRNDDYPNRPNRVAGVNGTSNGLLNAKYETYSAEVDVTPSERADFSAYYTYENNLSTTRYGSTIVTNMLTFDGTDKTNTFGVNANIVLVPEKWTFKANARRQKLDGLMGITGDPNGSFALARVAFGGIQNIDDYDDTLWLTASAQLDYTIGESWDFGFGYAYEKYTFADAYSFGTENFPATGGFYLKANDGPYKVNAVFAKLSYTF